MTEKINFPKDVVQDLFVEEFKNKLDLVLINLSTVDGFLLHQVNRAGQGVEGDKVAAISSSLCSMSTSAAREFFSDSSGIVNIETDTGKVVFQHVSLKDKDAIITLCCKSKVSLAEARFVAKRLKEGIEAAV